MYGEWESDCTEGTFDLNQVVNAVPPVLLGLAIDCVRSIPPRELSLVQSERTAQGPLTSTREVKRTEYRTPFSFNFPSSLFRQLLRLLTTLQHEVRLPRRHIFTNPNNVHLHGLAVHGVAVKCQRWMNKQSFLQIGRGTWIFAQTVALQANFTNSQIRHAQPNACFTHCRMTNAYVTGKFPQCSDDGKKKPHCNCPCISNEGWREGEDLSLRWGEEVMKSRKKDCAPWKGSGLLLPYHENNQSNWVKMYMLFQGHLDVHNEIMKAAQPQNVAQSRLLVLPGLQVTSEWLNPVSSTEGSTRLHVFEPWILSLVNNGACDHAHRKHNSSRKIYSNVEITVLYMSIPLETFPSRVSIAAWPYTSLSILILKDVQGKSFHLGWGGHVSLTLKACPTQLIIFLCWFKLYFQLSDIHECFAIWCRSK